MREFENALLSENKGTDVAMMEAYGLYLAHGGRPDGFMDMTVDDIQMMYTSYTVMNKNNVKDTITGMAKILGKMFCGDTE